MYIYTLVVSETYLIPGNTRHHFPHHGRPGGTRTSNGRFNKVTKCAYFLVRTRLHNRSYLKLYLMYKLIINVHHFDKLKTKNSVILTIYKKC